MSFTTNAAFLNALTRHAIHAEVAEIDHQRSFAALGAVDTSYIIQVVGTSTLTTSPRNAGDNCTFKTFRISKSYSDFRLLAFELMTVAQKSAKAKGKTDNSWATMPESVQNFISCSEAFIQVIDSEAKGHYLGKMSFQYVKDLGKQRKNTINSSLRVLLENYPENKLNEDSAVCFARLITEFFFTDHVVETDEIPQSFSSSPTKSSTDPSISTMPTIEERNGDGATTQFVNIKQDSKPISPSTSTQKPAYRTPPKDKDKKDKRPSIVPTSSKARLPKYDRQKIEEELKESGRELTIDDESLSTDENEKALFDTPISVALLVLSTSMIFWKLLGIELNIHADIAALALYTAFMIGSRMTASPKVIYIPSRKQSHRSTDNDVTKVIRTSLATSTRILSTKTTTAAGSVTEDSFPNLESPLPQFPKGATIGTVFNSWSEPVCSDFHVRGANYLVDKKKVTSKSFMFPTRGVDVFISDCCPENIGRYKVVMGGKLRKKPTFLINFRLPWGVMVSYHEIPSKFLPFMRYGYEAGLPRPSFDGLSPEEVCVCRFLMGNEDHKNKTLKIIPAVVKGPWIVKKAADGKPAILGTKMSTRYFYQPPDPAAGLAEYLEADLDIVGSAAARAILGLAQRYTKVLTLDLGFVIQGNSKDELPERMLMGARLHGIDPVAASTLPDEMDYFYEDDEKK